MRTLLLSSDLMVVSRVQGAAEKAGSTVRVATGGTAAAKLFCQEPADLVIVDLATPLAEMETLVAHVKSAADAVPRILAFGPHVHEDRLATARAAGCDVVMSRGQFFSQIESLLVG
jgi:DNA-binding response OmpR family regulator